MTTKARERCPKDFKSGRQCARESGHKDGCRWTVGEAASWLPDAPREVLDAFERIVNRRPRS